MSNTYGVDVIDMLETTKAGGSNPAGIFICLN